MGTTWLSILQRPALIFVSLFVIALLFYHETVTSLLRLWSSSTTYSHGLLLSAICTLLLYKRWSEVSPPLRLQPSFAALGLMLAMSIGWFLARIGNVLAVEQLSLWLLVGLMLPSVVGWRCTRTLVFPVALLIFALPIWDPLTPYLQSYTTRAVTLLVNMSGIPAIREGSVILVPAGSFDVTLACSGTSQFIVALMVATLYSYLNKLSLTTAAWLTVVAVLVAIIANTVRIYIVVIAGQLTGMQHYLVRSHWTIGWVLFGIGMFAFVLWANRYVAPESGTVAKRDQRSVPRPHAPDDSGPQSATLALRTAVLALGALAVGPALAHVYLAQAAPTSGLNLAIPAQIGSWQAIDAGADHYRPYFHGADAEYDTLYRTPDGPNVYLYVGYYAHQEQGKEAVYYLNKVYDGNEWGGVSGRQVSAGSPVGLRVKETRIRSKDGRTKIVWQWYYTNGSRTSNDYFAKVLNVVGTLRRHPGIAVIVIATDVNENIETARSQLMRFVADALEKVERGIDVIEST